MPYTARFNQKKRYIMVAVYGELNVLLLQAMASNVSKIIAQTGCRLILNDLREARLTKGAFDIYNMPKIARQEGVAPAIKRALLAGNREKEFYFLETVFMNQGNNVRMFANVEDAEAWLLGEKEKA